MDDATLDFLNKFGGGGGFSRGPDGKVTQQVTSTPMGDSSSPAVNFGSVQYNPNGPEVGNPLDFFNEKGDFSHSGVTKDIGSLGMDLLKFGALAGGMHFGLGSLMGGAGGGAAGAGGFVGEGALSGVPAWDAAAGMGGAAGAGAGGVTVGGAMSTGLP